MDKYYITNDLAVDSNEIRTIATTDKATLNVGVNTEDWNDLLIWVTYNNSAPILIGRLDIFFNQINLDDRNIFDDWKNLPFTKEEVRAEVTKVWKEMVAYEKGHEICLCLRDEDED